MSGPGDSSATELARVQTLLELGRFDEALAALAPVLARDPDDPVAHCFAAQAQLGLGQHQAAFDSAAYAAAHAPDEEWPHRLMSVAAFRLGNFGASVAAAREAVRCAPDLAVTYGQLAHALTRLPNSQEEAFAAARRAVLLAPDEASSHMALGAVAGAAGKRDDAARAYEQALAIEPENSAAHNELARLRFRKTNLANPSGLAQAASGFATAVGVDPSNATSRANLEITLRNFLSLSAYLVFVDAWLLLRVTAGSSSSGARVLPVVLLVVPGYFVYRFVDQVPPALRTHLIRLPWVSRPVRLAALLEGLALAAVLVAALAPASARHGIAVVAALLAVSGRIVLWAERSILAKSLPGSRSRPAVRTSILALLGCLLALLALMLAASIPQLGVAAAAGAVACGLAAAWPIRVILQRRRARF